MYITWQLSLQSQPFGATKYRQVRNPGFRRQELRNGAEPIMPLTHHQAHKQQERKTTIISHSSTRWHHLPSSENPKASFSAGSTYPCSLSSALEIPGDVWTACSSGSLLEGRHIFPKESPARLGFGRTHLAACWWRSWKGRRSFQKQSEGS